VLTGAGAAAALEDPERRAGDTPRAGALRSTWLRARAGSCPVISWPKMASHTFEEPAPDEPEEPEPYDPEPDEPDEPEPDEPEPEDPDPAEPEPEEPDPEEPEQGRPVAVGIAAWVPFTAVACTSTPEPVHHPDPRADRAPGLASPCSTILAPDGRAAP